MGNIKIGIVQFDILTGKVEENLKTTIDGIQSLASEGADIIVLPEMFSCSFDYENLIKHSEKTPEILSKLRQTAQQNNVIIAAMENIQIILCLIRFHLIFIQQVFLSII